VFFQIAFGSVIPANPYGGGGVTGAPKIVVTVEDVGDDGTDDEGWFFFEIHLGWSRLS